MAGLVSSELERTAGIGTMRHGRMGESRRCWTRHGDSGMGMAGGFRLVMSWRDRPQLVGLRHGKAGVVGPDCRRAHWN
jgi:hypothetical protein